MFNILVVDDDRNTRLLLKAVLESNGYTVKTAENGVSALEVIDDIRIDMVILDIMMPQMDGYKFTEQIRSAGLEIPILMLSAKQLPEDIKKGFIAGTDDFMTKPFDDEELVLRVKAIMRRAKIISDHKIEIGDVVLDYDSLTVRRRDEAVILPQKEFLLLYKLLSYPGKIFTRIELMDEIWGMDSDTGWETITVHIGRLRKKFDGWKEFEIKSVRGLGYKAVKNV